MTTSATIHLDFASLPWVLSLLSAPSTTILPPKTRIPKTNTEDSFIGTTLNTADTFRAYLIVQTPTETLTLVSLGSAINSHENTMHGGAVATIFDKVLGAAIPVLTFTAYLNTTFKKSVPTPGVVMCRAKVTKRDGRKYWVYGTMEDGAGTVMAEAEALYIDAVPKATKL